MAIDSGFLRFFGVPFESRLPGGGELLIAPGGALR